MIPMFYYMLPTRTGLLVKITVELASPKEEKNNSLTYFDPVHSKMPQETITHLSSKQKHLQGPRTVHDVGDLVGPIEFVGCISQKQPAVYGGGSDGDMLKHLGRNELLPDKNGMQLLLSVFAKYHRWCL
jgi:hypothetical protein